jgi:hypothetical protein
MQPFLILSLLPPLRQKEAWVQVLHTSGLFGSLMDFMTDADSFLLLFSSISSLSASTNHSVDLPGIPVLPFLFFFSCLACFQKHTKPPLFNPF